MIRPRRASTAKTRTRSPEPRRPLLWSIAEWAGHWGSQPSVFDWQCLVCESGTGQAPTRALANQAAHAHWRANHNHYEETS